MIRASVPLSWPWCTRSGRALRLRSAPISPGRARSTTSGSSTARSRRRPLAQKQPAIADAATVVLARAHLERYRERANPDDLSAARVALGTVRVSNLDSRDHVDFLMALGEALFFEDDYGAAATLFESGIDRAIAQGADTGEAMLDWWGSAVERHADALERDGRVNAFSAAARAHVARAGEKPRLRGGRVLPGRRRRAAAANRSRPGMPRSPAGSARGWPARDRRRCAPISTSSSCKASSPTASPRWPSSGANRRNRICAASGPS